MKDKRNELINLAEKMRTVLEYGEAVLEGIRTFKGSEGEITEDRWNQFLEGIKVDKERNEGLLDKLIVDLERFDRLVDLENRLNKVEERLADIDNLSRR